MTKPDDPDDQEDEYDPEYPWPLDDPAFPDYYSDDYDGVEDEDTDDE